MGAFWTSAGVQTGALARAVAAAFAASNLTPEQRNPPRIEIVDFSWQAPPLVTDLTLRGVPLQDYFDAPIALDETKLMGFWQKTLTMMHSTPSQLLRRRGGFTTCGWSMPKVKAGQRTFRFSRPEGWPGQMADHAGLVFSLEVAHAARISLPLKDFISDESNYYAVLRDGQIIGVKDGAVPGSSGWDMQARGHIGMYLQMGRGEIQYEPMYDQLGSLRSVLHTNAASFPNDFEALDVAIQALRYMAPNGHCPELHTEMHLAPVNRVAQKALERSLRDALDLMAYRDMSDRRKLQTLHSILVPDVITASNFRRHIFSTTSFPFTAAPGKMEKITAWLLQEYTSKVPQDLQQLKD